MNRVLNKILNNERVMLENFLKSRIIGNHKPTHIIIEPSNLCNINCVQCRSRESIEQLKREGVKFGNLSMEILKKILEFVPFAGSIHLSGWGEPYMHPDFEQILKEIRKKNKYAFIRFNTNATLLNKKRLTTLIWLPVNMVSISIDSPFKSTFESIRRGAKFEKIVENLLLINELKQFYNTCNPLIMFAFVVLKENIEQLPDMAKFAKKYNADFLYCINVDNKINDYGRPLPLGKDFYLKNKKFFRESLDLGWELGVPVIGPAMDIYNESLGSGGGEVKRNRSEYPLCMEPFRSVYINHYGGISPCCFLPYIEMGNLEEFDLLTIWNGDKYKTLRKSLFTHPTDLCEKCIFHRNNTIFEKYKIYQEWMD